jgi:hypothetical protein
MLLVMRKTKMASNLERLIRLADETFAVRNDPNQLNVNEEIMSRFGEFIPYPIGI